MVLRRAIRHCQRESAACSLRRAQTTEVNPDKASDHLTFDPSSVPPGEGQDGAVSIFIVPPGPTTHARSRPFPPRGQETPTATSRTLPVPSVAMETFAISHISINVHWTQRGSAGAPAEQRRDVQNKCFLKGQQGGKPEEFLESEPGGAERRR